MNNKERNIALVRALSDTADKILADHIVRLRAIDPAFRAALDMSLRYEDRLAQLLGENDGE